ncbi:30S ribosomal protein S18, partial [Candidatus Microgenomates bacterium]|nr:30S ribosomal protein S18 [Candidatus Microgenomates bacterium]
MAERKNHAEAPEDFDYKDIKTLMRYVNAYGQIDSRRRTGLTNKQQRRLAKAIKRAR